MTTSPLTARLVELACQAPSANNTQPWRWQEIEDRLRLYADRSRVLPCEDPLDRNVVISCGAALDHLRAAARALGVNADVTRFPEGPHADLLADIRLSPGEPSATAAEDIALLRARCTDRRRFTSWPVPAASLELLAREAHDRGAEASAVTDLRARFRLELLTQREHLDSLLGPGPVTETRALVESGDGMIVLGGKSDDRTAWLRTGEGLSALWLRATREGLAVVPMSLPVQLESVRNELHVSIPGVEPHILVRVGWQAIGRSALPRTPRLPLSDVLSEGAAVGPHA